MKPQISPRDIEQLSAHLDGQLPERQQAALAARLAAEPRLAAAQRQLQLTRAMLRRAPQRRLRRAFTLRAEMVAARRGGLAAWGGFNFASAAASLALLLVLIADFSANGLPAPVAMRKEPEAMTAAMPQAEDAGAAMEPMGTAEAFTLEAPAPVEDTLNEETARSTEAQPWLARKAGALEALLASLAAVTGLAAWHRRRS